jgi:hypothetical protein
MFNMLVLCASRIKIFTERLLRKSLHGIVTLVPLWIPIEQGYCFLSTVKSYTCL